MALKPLELAIHQNGTQAFIAADPTEIVLTPHQEQIVGGTKKLVPQPARNSQTFKIIWAGDTGIVRRTPNGVRSFDFIIVGLHDAEVAIGDHFEDDKFVIDYVFPPNGYEVKAGGVCNGQP